MEIQIRKTSGKEIKRFSREKYKSHRSSDEQLQRQRVLAASRVATDRESFIASLRDNDFFFVPEFEITKIVDFNVDVRDVRPNDFDVDFLTTDFGLLEQDEDPQSRSPRKTVLDDEPREEVFESFSEEAIYVDFEASGEGSGVDPMTTEATLTTAENIEESTRVELWTSLSSEEETMLPTTTTTGIQTTVQTTTTQAPVTRLNPVDKAAFFGNPGLVLFHKNFSRKILREYQKEPRK